MPSHLPNLEVVLLSKQVSPVAIDGKISDLNAHNFALHERALARQKLSFNDTLLCSIMQQRATFYFGPKPVQRLLLSKASPPIFPPPSWTLVGWLGIVVGRSRKSGNRVHQVFHLLVG